MEPIRSFVFNPTARDPGNRVGPTVPAKAEGTKMPVLEEYEHGDGFIELFIHGNTGIYIKDRAYAGVSGRS